ncbi:MAG: hypothetical protein IIB62_08685 [Proteobacteria bacterium]|nr:hypothetical protein [Pseudomonadota bacterium]
MRFDASAKRPHGASIAKDEDGFYEAFDIAAGVFKALTNAVRDAGGGDEDLRRLETDETLCRQIGELIVGEAKTTTETFSLAVDWSRTTEEMVEAGNYDDVNSDITEEHFPRPRTSGTVEAKYRFFHLDRYISSEDVVREMGIEWERSGPHENLAYGEKFPETQREFPIVGLGEPIWRPRNGRRDVVVLRGYGLGRGAGLRLWDGDWNSNYRFLARRK